MMIEVHPASGDRFDDLSSILAPKRPDAPACWCLTYRLTSSEFNSLRGQERPDRLRRLCEQDIAPGVIAYVDGEPAGWCAMGPREEMGRLRRSRTIQRLDDLPVWSIVCFVVKVGYRKQGLSLHLLQGAIDYAASLDVGMLEAYPIETDGQRVGSTFAFVGTTNLFASAGFTSVQETTARSGGKPRWIMRRPVVPALEQPSI
jgi:GNAT superfamily N-acetyltransferase